MPTVNWEDVPDSVLLPHDIYDAVIKSTELKFSKGGDGKVQKLMAVVAFEVTAPERFEGWVRTNYYVLGTDDDPEAVEEATSKDSGGFRGLKRLAKCANTPLDPELEVTLEALPGAQVSLMVTQEKDNQGRMQNRITTVYPVGEQLPGSLSTGSAPAAPARAAQRTAPPRPSTPPSRPSAPAARRAPVEEGTDENPQPAPRQQSFRRM